MAAVHSDRSHHLKFISRIDIREAISGHARENTVRAATGISQWNLFLSLQTL